MAFEYKVVELRSDLMGDKLNGDKLEKVLNEHAEDGWYLRTITAGEVRGRVGPGGVDGLLITLERQV